MKVYYANEQVNGKHNIIRVVLDSAAFLMEVNIGYPCSMMTIDEIVPDNKAICRSLVTDLRKVDVEGESRYYILLEGEDPVLHEKDGWEEVVSDV